VKAAKDGVKKTCNFRLINRHIPEVVKIVTITNKKWQVEKP